MSDLMEDAAEMPAHDSRPAGFEQDRLRGIFGTYLEFLILESCL
jgi:hypothetical protein